LSKKGHIPIRMCVACRERKEKKELLRIIYDGKLQIDAKQTMPGRGAYICPNEKCVQEACKKRRFDRAFRCSISQNIYNEFLIECQTWMREKLKP